MKTKMKIRNIILIACSAVVLLAAVACLAGSIMSHPKKKVKKKIAVRLYGESIGDKGLRYKHGSHIYDPKTGETLVDSISWLHIEEGDSIGILAKENHRAYINLNTATLLTPLNYHKAWAFSSDRGVMVRNDSVYIFRRDGSVVNEEGFPYKDQYTLTFEHNYLPIKISDGHVGLLDTAARWALPPEYKFIKHNFRHKLFNTKLEDQCIVYDLDLKPVLAGPFKQIDIDWSEGLIATEHNGIQHIYSYEGKMIYEVIFKSIDVMRYNTKVQDKNKNDIFEETDCYIYENYEGKCGLMDKRYKILTPPMFYDIKPKGKHIFFATFGEWESNFGTLIDDHGKPLH